MNLPFFKTKKDAASFSRDFYESYLFGTNSLGIDLVSTYAETTHRTICKTDPAFAEVKLPKLKDEMLGLQLEMIGTAWTHKSKEKAAIANSEFTKQYLADKDRADLWEIMGQYNQRIAESATYGSNSSTAGGRVHITYMNGMRIGIFDSWIAKGHDVEAVARVVNRLGSDTSWTRGVTPTMLGIRMMLRLDLEGTDSIAEKLAAVSFGFYQGASEALDGVKLTA